MEYLVLLVYIYFALDWALAGRFWLWELASVVPWFGNAAVWVIAILLSLISGQPLLAAGLLVFLPRIYQQLDIGLGIDAKSTVKGTLTLFNWNTEYWTEDHVNFYKLLKEQQADVYHLQEAWITGTDDNPVVRDVADEMFDQLGSKYQIVQHLELVTASKFPIEHIVKDTRGNFLRVDVRINGRLVSFYNVHIPVHIRPKLAQSPRLLLADVKEMFSLRKQRSKALWEELQSNPNPKVISGDFNTQTSQPFIYPYLKRYVDAFRRVAVGIPVTIELYGLRAWRIDYVLLDKVAPLKYSEIDPEGMSDHSGILVRLRV